MEEFWQTCATRLQQELTPQQFSAWIKPLAPLDFEDGRLRIAAPNRFKLDWVKTQFADRITRLAAEFWQSPVDVQFVLDPRNGALKKAAALPQPAPASGQESMIERAEPAEESHFRRDQSRINQALTFDSFVTGKANQLARPRSRSPAIRAAPTTRCFCTAAWGWARRI
jgi:chromosomal replication initiator protein